jgi:hypothetical protein
MSGITNPRVEVINSGGTLVNEALFPYPAIVHGLHAAHSTGSAAWLHIYDSATAVANGTVPLMAHTIKAGGDAVVEHTRPIYFENGIYICESDTLSTLTLTAASHLFIHIIIERSTP